ncbi:MAG: winged helix-turn-helix transcriptional regulator, partial [Bacteroidetes bacterium]|nr:winged helix-turn-helix transcriptional regulator [Bacteroidota bacterium]
LLTKEQIIEHVWGLDFDTGTNILEVYISYLRNKIGNQEGTKFIHTRKGLGYIFKDIN